MPGVGFVTDPERAEQLAVAALRGVGGDIEWWQPTGDTNRAVSHLRVPTTPAEQLLIPAGLAAMDAGPEGVLRPRTR